MDEQLSRTLAELERKIGELERTLNSIAGVEGTAEAEPEPRTPARLQPPPRRARGTELEPHRR